MSSWGGIDTVWYIWVVVGWFQAAFRARWRLPMRCWCDAPRWIRVAWLMGAPSQDSQGLDEKIHPGTSGGGVQQGDKTRRGSSHDLAWLFVGIFGSNPCNLLVLSCICMYLQMIPSPQTWYQPTFCMVYQTEGATHAAVLPEMSCDLICNISNVFGTFDWMEIPHWDYCNAGQKLQMFFFIPGKCR